MLLRTDALARAEKVIGGAEWLLDLKRRLFGSPQPTRTQRNAMLWLAVAKAPEGFCHPRASMLGSLMDDIVSGKSMETIKSGFAAKMDGLAYQRPQAAPSAGSIAQAEKLVSKLDLARALERRFARLEEVVALWKPRDMRAKPLSGGGVFDHLKKPAPSASELRGNQGRITWAKFERDILPHVAKLTTAERMAEAGTTNPHEMLDAEVGKD